MDAWKIFKMNNLGWIVFYMVSLQNNLFVNWYHTEPLFSWYLNFTIILHVQMLII
jgi:hypothetical protein